MSATTTATAADPLELFRRYTVEGKTIEYLDADGNPSDLLKAATVRFGEDASFPRDTPTRYSRGNSDSDQYTLSALLHFFSHRDQSFYEYMKTTNTLGLQTVSFSDRGSLLDYITGKTDKFGGADNATAVAGEKHASSDAAGDGRRTRLRTGEADGAGGESGLSADSANDVAREVMRRERSLVSTSSALSSGKSFAHVQDLIKELFPSKSAVDAKNKASSASGSKAENGASRRKSSHRKRRDPIIVVPAAATAMLNMYNIQELLQNHNFVDNRALLEQGGQKPREIFVEHVMPSTGQNMRFRVVDSVQDFGEADWNSLVCVFTQGAAWQFKNWIWKSPEEVFQNCLGMYPKHQDEQPKESTRTWGISPLDIERNKRHMDRATVVGLWSSIEQFMARNKPDFFM
ncbi:accessory factor associated with RNA polymerase II [Coemansia sp. RSA 2523]|nr:accessory factor associated with RNA polymerase II [Coemansia sp. RSA 1824]KAJ1798830.1 accessory factor associated with RNA polymerase II [Coemansia sp. RSA 2523]KAJ2143487.1 accessory factor associated with RNA polymerase II [Coemansia sp. RSA 564]KAJ2158517.1 accessory factor associated with RNA polymerase II [Coemansia sp. RSA 562]KAJ2182564.1 accessory factor associated with RNA polymerase II [Coemansia sp. RSA 551]KAJ2190153.1 accessory factor associated with RNA polymerase II [Coeman